MNYEQKYNEALEKLQEALAPTEDGCKISGLTRGCIENIFPELKESHDDRIKREIVAYINELADLKNEKIPTKWLAWLEKQKKPEDVGEISDGYHTFNELYQYRMLYNAAFFNLLPKEMVHKSKRHHDGEECFGGGWFIVMANLPTGQISNHYELKDWDLFQIPEKEVADEWDGHTPNEAADRLHKYLLEKQGEQKTAYPHWISVEDELPPIRQGVIAYNGVTSRKAWVLEDGSWIADTHKEWERNCFKQYPVTHWMPLPSVEHLKEKKL